MENAVDALKIAASVLLFTIALSVAITSFGQVRHTADTVLEIQDRETEYIDGNFYYESNNELARTVSLETVIPTIYRVYYENYRIVFNFKNGDTDPLYTNISNDIKEKRYSLDLDYETKIAHSNSKQKVDLLLNALVYGKTNMEYDKLYRTKIKLPSKSLIERLNNCEIKEKLGVYYPNDNPNTPEANKIEKRIITYEITNKK